MLALLMIVLLTLEAFHLRLRGRSTLRVRVAFLVIVLFIIALRVIVAALGSMMRRMRRVGRLWLVFALRVVSGGLRMMVMVVTLGIFRILALCLPIATLFGARGALRRGGRRLGTLMLMLVFVFTL